MPLRSRRIAPSTIRSLAVFTILALVCLGVHPSAASAAQLRRVAYDVLPTAVIDTSATTVGIADSDLYGKTKEEVATTLDTLKALGVTQIRVFVPWAYVEPLQGFYNWDDVDKMVDAAEDRGIAVLAAVTSTPTWASDDLAPNAAPRSPEDYAAFVTALADRYGTAANDGAAKIAAYEVWNEPNGAPGWAPAPDPPAYTQLLKAAYAAIKAVDPDALVIAAGLGAGFSAATVTINPVDFLQGMYDSGAKGYFDAVAYHPYQLKMMFSDGNDYPGSPYRQLIRMREVMDDNGDTEKLIWTTEYGLPTAVVSEAEQAAFIADFLATWSSMAGVGPMFIYTTRDRETGSTESEDTFGIFETDWTPKDAAAVIAQWIADHPVFVPDEDPTWVDCIKSAIAAVGQVIHGVIQAGVAVAKFFVKAFVNVVDWAISAVVSGIKWVAGAVVDTVNWVVDKIHDVIDALRPGASTTAPAPTAVAPVFQARQLAADAHTAGESVVAEPISTENPDASATGSGTAATVDTAATAVETATQTPAAPADAEESVAEHAAAAPESVPAEPAIATSDEVTAGTEPDDADTEESEPEAAGDEESESDESESGTADADPADPDTTDKDTTDTDTADPDPAADRKPDTKTGDTEAGAGKSSTSDDDSPASAGRGAPSGDGGQ